MKTPGNGQGSFGIPPQIQEAAERARANAYQNVKKAGDQPAATEEPVVAEAAPVAEAPITDEVVEQSNPLKILETLGISFDEETLQQLIFRGSVEKTIDIVKGKLTAKCKTLTVEEHDLVDEILAEEVQNIKMTNAGFENRRSLLILAFGVTELAGKAVCKPVLEKDKKTLDKVATAKKRREVLQAMSPGIVNIIMQKQAAMTVAFNMIASDPGAFLKNS